MYSAYLKKQAVRPRFFSEPPNPNLGIVVVIPAYNEQTLIPTMESLYCCELPQKGVEVIIVFNASENDSKELTATNQKACKAVEEWCQQLAHAKFSLHIIEEYSLPKKHAGVGLARKIGMDEAVRRFELLEKDGVIVCFDADSKCQKNYLVEIDNHFEWHGKTEACSIHFEHPLEGSAFEQEVYTGISCYELHLRYYKNGLAYANLPYAFHTIGSSMAVRASAYCKEGGMNKRKAGEDFYFLQKFISKGTLSELHTTTVFPSPRSSDRVPFGTGRAIKEMLEGERAIEFSYAFETFEVLKQCFCEVSSWYDDTPKVNPYLLKFMGEESFAKKLAEIRTQSSSREAFVKRFFQWFNAFQTLKFVHFLRDKFFGMKQLKGASRLLLTALLLDMNDDEVENYGINGLLSQFRSIDTHKLPIKN